ncbi:hypothetical protein [Sphingomonas sp. KC8]|uniref:hypothetical protein n=1 Tax=Sphingomonas sp. KC8 TaxID=1030157 RepID=UPI00031D0432|nr:hypothetical protein [Sphingomonas sp. KC8]ARS27685.1 polyketide cyclase [Sphingomonas sp. KC8]
MLPARTFSVSIKREWRDLYEQIWQPAFFAKWASGLAQSELREDAAGWFTDGPEGPVRIRFTPHNPHGVMDHVVETESGAEISVPLRVIQNGDGAEVMLTLFRQPDMDDERFSADTKWVIRDLKRLRELCERRR